MREHFAHEQAAESQIHHQTPKKKASHPRRARLATGRAGDDICNAMLHTSSFSLGRWQHSEFIASRTAKPAALVLGCARRAPRRHSTVLYVDADAQTEV